MTLDDINDVVQSVEFRNVLEAIVSQMGAEVERRLNERINTLDAHSLRNEASRYYNELSAKVGTELGRMSLDLQTLRERYPRDAEPLTNTIAALSSAVRDLAVVARTTV